jgi:hypothetical protein
MSHPSSSQNNNLAEKLIASVTETFSSMLSSPSVATSSITQELFNNQNLSNLVQETYIREQLKISLHLDTYLYVFVFVIMVLLAILVALLCAIFFALRTYEEQEIQKGQLERQVYESKLKRQLSENAGPRSEKSGHEERYLFDPKKLCYIIRNDINSDRNISNSNTGQLQSTEVTACKNDYPRGSDKETARDSKSKLLLSVNVTKDSIARLNDQILKISDTQNSKVFTPKKNSSSKKIVRNNTEQKEARQMAPKKFQNLQSESKRGHGSSKYQSHPSIAFNLATRAAIKSPDEYSSYEISETIEPTERRRVSFLSTATELRESVACVTPMFDTRRQFVSKQSIETPQTQTPMPKLQLPMGAFLEDQISTTYQNQTEGVKSPQEGTPKNRKLVPILRRRTYSLVYPKADADSPDLIRKELILEEEQILESKLHQNQTNSDAEGIKRVSVELRNLRRVKFSHTRLCNPSLWNIEDKMTHFLKAT